ncbi:DUF262 domain-containing protein [Flavobacterium soyangense]|uniref:DUF262 domain-containing protein n=1 Tax=Flavobacterium soyangense TaxID=2023265 RepID=A0A930XWC5_9FLAO|nr:DUF262 domain-containing protein [Flavobacterium soyangense]MBF2709231.1 DUF262 domain-containing protein [Flavobacterium soyangense]
MSQEIKLKQSIPSNTIKIIELYNKIEANLLDTSPNFQRKLVWKKQHKYAFINTVLLNYPFPEIYIASSEIDVNSFQAKEIVVDGQQRLNAIVDYIKGINDFSNQNKIKAFNELSVLEKKEFLNYPVSMKDLKDLPENIVKEIFRRINSTEYSLNTNEILNAQFGDGEFAIFCKQLADAKYEVSERETDVLITEEKRKIFNSFFLNNNIFTENDIKRMFDSQYVMLITSTLFEGKYFGRSLRINDYLEKYNFEFKNYDQILDVILNSIEIISKLKLSKNSYWFNKPNLFSLIIELTKIDTSKLVFEDLERALFDLENKVDLYFNGDEEDMKLLTSDETKFFEVSRQGSHELSAREHRGKVVSSILRQSTIENNDISIKEESIEEKNINYLNQKNIQFSKLIPTETGLTKGIMDAISGLREFLKVRNYHNYEDQKLGPDNKVKKIAKFKNLTDEIDTEISLYRSNGRGDYRIWFTSLKDFANPQDELALYIDEGVLKVLNLSKYDYTNVF